MWRSSSVDIEKEELLKNLEDCLLKGLEIPSFHNNVAFEDPFPVEI